MVQAAAALCFISAAGPVSAAAPGNVRFTGTYASSATLAWSFGGDPMAQRPLMVLSAAPDFSTAVSSAQGELGAETTGYYGLTPNSTYFFKVKVSTDLDVFYSAPVSTITDPVPPPSPEVAGVFLSSVAVTWDGNGNAPGTYYYAEAAQDEGFTAAVVSTLTAGGGFVFEDLVRNTTYYIRAWTVGFSGVESSPASFGSTVTLSAPPLSPGYTAVYATAAALSWSGNGNDPGNSYQVQVSSDGFQSVLYSSTAVGPAFTAYGLTPATTYYFRAAALNSAGMGSGYAVFDATSTRANIPKLHATSTFPGGESDPADRVNIRWDKNGNPTWVEYFIGV
ncbi:MAG TPA: fibronectin type III domain-containing protein, partial [Elusimicrobiales bacterium]|nr:fibronectin type III domain-containing protein [Elusimicrobiales bacterium]